MSLIFLTGMPGAGKTYWGRALAEAYRLPFTDLDEFIEAQEQKTITEIFETVGETGFRQIETAALKKIVASGTGSGIVACGGGTVTVEENMDLMRAVGCIVYLKAGIAILAHRLKGEENRRPLLTREPFLVPTLQQMLSARDRFYEKADHILPVENLSLATFAEIIATCTKQH